MERGRPRPHAVAVNAEPQTPNLYSIPSTAACPTAAFNAAAATGQVYQAVNGTFNANGSVQQMGLATFRNVPNTVVNGGKFAEWVEVFFSIRKHGFIQQPNRRLDRAIPVCE